MHLHESILARICVHRHTAAPLKTTSERKSKAVPTLANFVKSSLSRVGLLSVPRTVNRNPAFRRRSTRNPLTGDISKWNAQKNALIYLPKHNYLKRMEETVVSKLNSQDEPTVALEQVFCTENS